jgi:hypothetical protein
MRSPAWEDRRPGSPQRPARSHRCRENLGPNDPNRPRSLRASGLQLSQQMLTSAAGSRSRRTSARPCASQPARPGAIFNSSQTLPSRGGGIGSPMGKQVSVSVRVVPSCASSRKRRSTRDLVTRCTAGSAARLADVLPSPARALRAAVQGRRPAATDDRPTQRRRRYHSSPALVGATPTVAGAFLLVREPLHDSGVVDTHQLERPHPPFPPVRSSTLQPRRDMTPGLFLSHHRSPCSREQGE